MSALVSTAAGEDAQSTFLNKVSGKLAREPAPASITTRAPVCANFSATSGVRLTRVSCGALSRSAPIVTGMRSLVLGHYVVGRPRGLEILNQMKTLPR